MIVLMIVAIIVAMLVAMIVVMIVHCSSFRPSYFPSTTVAHIFLSGIFLLGYNMIRCVTAEYLLLCNIAMIVTMQTRARRS